MNCRRFFTRQTSGLELPMFISPRLASALRDRLSTAVAEHSHFLTSLTSIPTQLSSSKLTLSSIISFSLLIYFMISHTSPFLVLFIMIHILPLLLQHPSL